MTDIRTILDPAELISDYLLLPSGQLDARFDLATAVTLSLFTDRRAEASDQLPFGETDRRGVWSDLDGDTLYGIPRQGSRLWLLSREKAQEPVRQMAEFYTAEALQWLIDIRAVSRFDIVTEFAGPASTRRLDALITAVRGDEAVIALRYQPLWNEFI